jgi:hypothetical protein
VTLERTSETPAVLAALAAKPDPEMTKSAMTPVRKADQGPRLALTNCFVRGEGDLFQSATSRPCQLDVTNSVAALSGSLVCFSVTGSGDAATTKVAVNLSQSTTYLGGSLVKLVVAKETKDLGAVVPIQCKAGKCLFVSAKEGGKQPLIQLVGPQRDGVVGKFSWTKDENNGYGGYSTLLTADSNGEQEMQMTTQVTMDKWKREHCGGDEGPDKVTLSVPADAKLTQLLPRDFAIKDPPKEAEGLGADLGKLRAAP